MLLIFFAKVSNFFKVSKSVDNFIIVWLFIYTTFATDCNKLIFEL